MSLGRRWQFLRHRLRTGTTRIDSTSKAARDQLAHAQSLSSVRSFLRTNPKLTAADALLVCRVAAVCATRIEESVAVIQRAVSSTLTHTPLLAFESLKSSIFASETPSEVSALLSAFMASHPHRSVDMEFDMYLTACEAGLTSGSLANPDLAEILLYSFLTHHSPTRPAPPTCLLPILDTPPYRGSAAPQTGSVTFPFPDAARAAAEAPGSILPVLGAVPPPNALVASRTTAVLAPPAQLVVLWSETVGTPLPPAVLAALAVGMRQIADVDVILQATVAAAPGWRREAAAPPLWALPPGLAAPLARTSTVGASDEAGLAKSTALTADFADGAFGTGNSPPHADANAPSPAHHVGSTARDTTGASGDTLTTTARASTAESGAVAPTEAPDTLRTGASPPLTPADNSSMGGAPTDDMDSLEDIVSSGHTDASRIPWLAPDGCVDEAAVAAVVGAVGAAGAQLDALSRVRGVADAAGAAILAAELSASTQSRVLPADAPAGDMQSSTPQRVPRSADDPRADAVDASAPLAAADGVPPPAPLPAATPPTPAAALAQWVTVDSLHVACLRATAIDGAVGWVPSARAWVALGGAHRRVAARAARASAHPADKALAQLATRVARIRAPESVLTGDGGSDGWDWLARLPRDVFDANVLAMDPPTQPVAADAGAGATAAAGGVHGQPLGVHRIPACPADVHAAQVLLRRLANGIAATDPRNLVSGLHRLVAIWLAARLPINAASAAAVLHTAVLTRATPCSLARHAAAAADDGTIHAEAALLAALPQETIPSPPYRSTLTSVVPLVRALGMRGTESTVAAALLLLSGPPLPPVMDALRVVGELVAAVARAGRVAAPSCAVAAAYRPDAVFVDDAAALLRWGPCRTHTAMGGMAAIPSVMRARALGPVAAAPAPLPWQSYATPLHAAFVAEAGLSLLATFAALGPAPLLYALGVPSVEAGTAIILDALVCVRAAAASRQSAHGASAALAERGAPTAEQRAAATASMVRAFAALPPTLHGVVPAAAVPLKWVIRILRSRALAAAPLGVRPAVQAVLLCVYRGPITAVAAAADVEHDAVHVSAAAGAAADSVADDTRDPPPQRALRALANACVFTTTLPLLPAVIPTLPPWAAVDAPAACTPVLRSSFSSSLGQFKDVRAAPADQVAIALMATASAAVALVVSAAAAGPLSVGAFVWFSAVAVLQTLRWHPHIRVLSPALVAAAGRGSTAPAWYPRCGPMATPSLHDAQRRAAARAVVRGFALSDAAAVMATAVDLLGQTVPSTAPPPTPRGDGGSSDSFVRLVVGAVLPQLSEVERIVRPAALTAPCVTDAVGPDADVTATAALGVATRPAPLVGPTAEAIAAPSAAHVAAAVARLVHPAAAIASMAAALRAELATHATALRAAAVATGAPTRLQPMDVSAAIHAAQMPQSLRAAALYASRGVRVVPAAALGDFGLRSSAIVTSAAAALSEPSTELSAPMPPAESSASSAAAPAIPPMATPPADAAAPSGASYMLPHVAVAAMVEASCVALDATPLSSGREAALVPVDGAGAGPLTHRAGGGGECVPPLPTCEHVLPSATGVSLVLLPPLAVLSMSAATAFAATAATAVCVPMLVGAVQAAWRVRAAAKADHTSAQAFNRMARTTLTPSSTDIMPSAARCDPIALLDALRECGIVPHPAVYREGIAAASGPAERAAIGVRFAADWPAWEDAGRALVEVPMWGTAAFLRAPV